MSRYVFKLPDLGEGVDLRAVDVPSVIASTLAGLSKLSEARRITLQVEAPVDVPPARSESSMTGGPPAPWNESTTAPRSRVEPSRRVKAMPRSTSPGSTITTCTSRRVSVRPFTRTTA